MGLFNKKELKKIAELEDRIKILDTYGLNEITQKVEEKKEEYERINHKCEEELNDYKKQIAQLSWELSNYKKDIEKAKNDLFDINEELEYESFGLYQPKYKCMDSEEYKEAITNNRKQQKSMNKDFSALNYFDNWTLDGSQSKGRALNKDNMKMVLRAFNNECDVLIDKVKFNNFEKVKSQIEKAAKAIDKLNVRNKISIKESYIKKKIEELQLVHEYAIKKQEEKEAMREAREQEREEAKLMKEIQEAKKKIEKEMLHYSNAKEKYLKELETASDDRKQEIKDKIAEIDGHLAEVEKNLQDVDYRESNQRAGYVYIISNIGSFGPDVYKIGMTRRLDPQDRVDELGDASVPFRFDVHAMIFSDDAPALENALHRAFDDRKVNMINGRKEFFRVPLNEIKEEVKKHHEKLIEIKDIPEAEQYRETLLIQKEMKSGK